RGQRRAIENGGLEVAPLTLVAPEVGALPRDRARPASGPDQTDMCGIDDDLARRARELEARDGGAARDGEHRVEAADDPAREADEGPEGGLALHRRLRPAGHGDALVELAAPHAQRSDEVRAGVDGDAAPGRRDREAPAAGRVELRHEGCAAPGARGDQGADG